MRIRLLAFAVIAVVSCKKPEVVKVSNSLVPARESAKESPGDAPTQKAADIDPPASEVNQRTRPSLPPVEREYPKPETPVAATISGKPGFVISPFNGKIIDVRDIPPGTLVQDPTAAPEEKKYFRTP